MKNKLFALLLVLLSIPALAAGDYLVRQGGTVLTREDVMRSIETYVPEASRPDLLGSEKKLRDFVAQLFATRKLAEEAKNRALSADERWKVDSATERALTQVQLNYLVGDEPAASFEKAAREFYLANPTQFSEPEQVHVEHILISTKDRSKDDALARANEVLKEVNAGKEAFGDLARRYSEDPSAKQNGGDLGFFSHGSMVKPFEDAAFGLKTSGEIAGPVETPFGYHIIRFIERKPASTKPFDTVKDQLVKNEMRKYRRTRVFQEYERVGKLPGIEVDQEAIKALVKPLPPLEGSAHGK